MTAIQTAMYTIGKYQTTVGAQANILNTQADLTKSFITTNTKAYGDIMNANMAEESANLATAQINRDASTAMLAQANTMNKDIVKYLLQTYGG
jgi:flagellin-like hook-associated protein FlgL